MNLLNNLIATVGIIIACVTLWVLWFKTEPKYNHKLNKNNFLSVLFWLIYPISMLFLAANIVASTSWRYPFFEQNNLFFNLFMTRVNNQETTAHSISYLTIPIFFFYCLYRTKDSWRSALASAFIVYLHESIWFVFYYLNYWNTINWQTEIIADVNFLLLICTFGQIYYKKYGFSNKVWGIVGSQIVYDIFWFAIGFPITCTNNSDAMIRFGVTQWIDNLLVNMLEVGGWLILLYFSILWVHLDTLNKTDGKISHSEVVNR